MRQIVRNAQNLMDGAPTTQTRRDVVPRRQVQRRLTTDETNEMVAGFRAGMAVKTLAARYRVNRSTISSRLRASGLEPRPRGLSPESIPDVIRLYEEGWSLARLGQKFGVDGATVWRALKSAGVVMRSPNAPRRRTQFDS